ncbi:MAG: UvrD-helicase domain-containing protein, partial [Oscillospiraceae bacterium]|nr:UvrD-helicase domain-containing protein [Oscillospiraceae bacterium]
MSDLLDGLNESQRLAVTATEGFVRVVAGAGSGKTRVLTRRFAWLTSVLGVLPSDILCVTFTNKAAAEMRRRIRELTGDSDTGLICTFHSLCVTILSEEAHAVGYPESFLVLDNSDIDAMLAQIYEERGLTLRDYTFSRARDLFEIRKTITQKDYYRDLMDLSVDALKLKYD